MSASHSPGTHYLWEDGSSGTHRCSNESGGYRLRYQNDSLCTDYIDSFSLTYPVRDPLVSFEADTLACINEILPFYNTSDTLFTQFTWSFGDQTYSETSDPFHVFTAAGNYWIRLVGSSNGICQNTVFRNVTVDPIVEVSFRSPLETICMGEAISYTIVPTDNSVTQLCWQFGDGGEACGRDTVRMHAYDSPGQMWVNLRTQFRSCPEGFFSDTISVSEIPVVNLGGDTSLCLKAQRITLHNFNLDTVGKYHYLWNTGDTLRSLNIVHPGNYSLTLTDGYSRCAATDSVLVVKDCYLDLPNVFSPDGDGNNDYFFPHQPLSHNLLAFKLQVVNRWGQLVLESQGKEGRGWDGQCNGQNQPQGVYVYQLYAEFEHGDKQYYRGNLTLLR